MASNKIQTEDLRSILENSLVPQRLDSHPWTRSLIVYQAGIDAPELLTKSRGQRLVIALARLFSQMMPSTTPRRGKRLDTRWGEFGIIAAEYFAPILYGTPAPETLRQAWGKIDQSILLFVYGKPIERLTAAEKEPYVLVGNELEVAPNSTLSDWHRKGLERLMSLILSRENFLSGSLSKPALIRHTNHKPLHPSKKSKAGNSVLWRYLLLVLGILVITGLIFGWTKARQVYRQTMLVRQDVYQFRDLLTSAGPNFERLNTAKPAFTTLNQDLDTLKSETKHYLWMGAWLTWVPTYGGDLASSRDLMTMADSLLASVNLVYQAAAPVLEKNDLPGITPTSLTEVLVQSQPQLIQAHQKIAEVASARSRVDVTTLTPEIRDLIVNDLDPLLPLMRDGLTVAEELPRLMGATTEGPKSYLLMVENSDELRPTGGLVTAIGILLVQNGQISAPMFENEDETINPLIDWSKPYPAAPWQLQLFMNSQVMLMRDTSWYTNYPTAALYAQTLYSYVSNASVDGVIAFDQQFLIDLLKITGPVQLSGVPYPIDANNVVAYMRSAKAPTAADLASPDWNNKIFIKLISDALLEKLSSGTVSPFDLFPVLLQDLNEHHLLLQVDSPILTTILVDHRWNGSVRPEPGDFLMAVDTNVGFNKTNAVVASNMVYDIDLTNPSAPTSSLTVTHINNAVAMICREWNKIRLPGQEYYPIDDCYWNYLRVYLVNGAKLLDATPQFVPANWMLIKQDVSARVDTLDEGIPGVQAFGTLQVVPGGESIVTGFSFSLPASIVQTADGLSTYHLFVQKQPGTLAEPITIRLHLPNNATIQSTTDGAIIQDQNVLFQTDLQKDVEISVVFKVP